MRAWLASIAVCAGCRQLYGFEDPVEMIDAPSIDAKSSLVITGATYDSAGPRLGDVQVGWETDPANTPLGSTTSDTNGNYRLVVPFAGVPLAGHLHAALVGYLATYFYLPSPPTMDIQIGLEQITSGTYTALCNDAQVTCTGNTALIVLVVVDLVGTPLSGVTLSPTVAATVRYDNGNVPDPTATATSADGQIYVFASAPGDVTMSASKAGWTFSSASLVARASALTLTYMVGQQ